MTGAAAEGDDPRALLRRAMRLHSDDEIDAALASAERAVTLDPDFCEDGLAALERAAALCPEDAAILYTLGWCREFVAHALEHPRARQPHQPVAQDAATLYAATTEVLRRALTLDPDPQLRGDIEDILDVVANATGLPWDEEG